MMTITDSMLMCYVTLTTEGGSSSVHIICEGADN